MAVLVVGRGCCFSGWRGFAGQLRGLDLEDSCAWLGAAGPGTGSEGDWWPSGDTGDCCCLDLGWGSLNVHSSGGCGRGWQRKWRADGDVGENRWLEVGRWCQRRGSSRWRGVKVGLEDCLCDGLAWALDQVLGEGGHR